MYFIYINVSPFSKIDKQYLYIIVRFNLYVLVNSMISVTLITLHNTFHIDYVHTCTSIFLTNSTLLLFVVFCLFYEKSHFHIEVNTFNVKACSLYMWLGYQILYQKTDYYHSLNNQFTFLMHSYAAYTLSNTKFYCKNMLRRILIFLNT